MATQAFKRCEDEVGPELARLHALLPQLSMQAMQAQRVCDEAARMLDAIDRSESIFGHRADVRSLIHLRTLRDQHLPADWFSDPAWDILLHLYQAHLDAMEMTVGELIERTGLKPTTASRWLDCIGNRNWLTRRRCDQDHRRIFVELTAKGAAALNDYFEAVRCR